MTLFVSFNSLTVPNYEWLIIQNICSDTPSLRNYNLLLNDIILLKAMQGTRCKNMLSSFYKTRLCCIISYKLKPFFKLYSRVLLGKQHDMHLVLV